MNKLDELIADIKEILAGVDETEADSDIGWWETSTGADLGSERLSAIAALITTLKDTHVLVPKEPTEAMILQGSYEILNENGCYGIGVDLSDVVDCYKAMLSSAEGAE